MRGLSVERTVTRACWRKQNAPMCDKILGGFPHACQKSWLVTFSSADNSRVQQAIGMIKTEKLLKLNNSWLNAKELMFDQYFEIVGMLCIKKARLFKKHVARISMSSSVMVFYFSVLVVTNNWMERYLIAVVFALEMGQGVSQKWPTTQRLILIGVSCNYCTFYIVVYY
jgi:hypothetical protein